MQLETLGAAGVHFAGCSSAGMLSHVCQPGCRSTFPFHIPASAASLARIEGRATKPPPALLASQGEAWLPGQKATDLGDWRSGKHWELFQTIQSRHSTDTGGLQIPN